MALVKAIVREMPDGSSRRVYPFHISLEGLKKAIICRDDEDYDVLVKYVCLCALRMNVRLVTYVVISNHLHIIVLAENADQAKAVGEEIRRRYAMWFSRKYHERMLYHDKCVDAQWIDTYWYLRNAIAYDFRNALDNSDNLERYPWSGYRACFSGGRCPGPVRSVSSLTKREREVIFHTNDSIVGTGWLINDENYLEPVSTCDYQYIEEAFDRSQAFLLKTIGTVNMAEMQEKLIDAPRTRLHDGDFFKMVSEVSERWFNKPLAALSLTEKMRLIPYVNRTSNTTVPQLARAFGIDREKVSEILRMNR